MGKGELVTHLFHVSCSHRRGNVNLLSLGIIRVRGSRAGCEWLRGIFRATLRSAEAADYGVIRCDICCFVIPLDPKVISWGHWKVTTDTESALLSVDFEEKFYA